MRKTTTRDKTWKQRLKITNSTELIAYIQKKTGFRLKDNTPINDLKMIASNPNKLNEEFISDLDFIQKSLGNGLEKFKSCTKVQKLCRGCTPEFCPTGRIIICMRLNGHAITER